MDNGVVYPPPIKTRRRLLRASQMKLALNLSGLFSVSLTWYFTEKENGSGEGTLWTYHGLVQVSFEQCLH